MEIDEVSAMMKADFAAKKPFSVAYNGDDRLVRYLKERAPFVDRAFGKTPLLTNVAGSGRAFCEMEYPAIEKMGRHIKELKDEGIKFNWLMNGTILAANEFSREGRAAISEELEMARKFGAEYVTVSVPFLAKFIVKHFPELKPHVSVFAHVDTPQKARRWEDLGVSGVCLDRKLTRDFRTLRAIREAVNMELEVLANDPCLINCPYELYHDDMMARASLPGSGDYLHYCSFTCLRDFMRDPAELVRSTFVRPEDTDEYLDIGIDRLKIVDRNRPTDWIINSLDAYIDRKYEGNLADLLSLFSSFGMRTPDMENVGQQLPGRQAIHGIWDGIRTILGVQMDNSVLDGFLEFFKSADCNRTSCGQCGHCASVADKAVKIDPVTAKKAVKILEKVAELLHARDMSALNFSGFDSGGKPIFIDAGDSE